jgi:hypothetical protein
MKLSTFDLPDGKRHIGAFLDGDNKWVDFTVSTNSPVFASMLSLIDAGDEGLEQARHLVKQAKVTRTLADIKLAAALPEPRQMRDFLCFEKHFRQARANRHLFMGNAAQAVASFTERDPAKVEIPAIWYE